MTATADAPDTAHEIHITREYDAPLAQVWAAWTDPAQLAQWWGPRGFSITTSQRDLRPGGSWTYVMHGPDGTDWPNFTRYHAVEPGARLVYDHGASSADATPLFRVTVEFRALGARTELDMRMAFSSAQALAASRAVIKSANGNSTWDRLAEHVEKQTTRKEIFVINRSVDAPIETVFDMWTTPEHVAVWLPPTGFTMEFRRVDIRTGGHGFHSMTSEQFTMYGRFDYLEVRRPDLLRYTQSFADAEERVTRHPGAPVWPEQMLTTVTLASEGTGQTRVTVRTESTASATPEEMAAFVQERAGMTKGWTGSLDKLEQVLTTQAV